MRSFSGLVAIGVLAAGAYAVVNDVQAGDVVEAMGSATEQAQEFVGGINIEGEDSFDVIEDQVAAGEPVITTTADRSNDAILSGLLGSNVTAAPAGTIAFAVDTKNDVAPLVEAPAVVARPQVQEGSTATPDVTVTNAQAETTAPQAQATDNAPAESPFPPAPSQAPPTSATTSSTEASTTTTSTAPATESTSSTTTPESPTTTQTPVTTTEAPATTAAPTTTAAPATSEPADEPPAG